MSERTPTAIEILARASAVLAEVCRHESLAVEVDADIQCGDVRIEVGWVDGPPIDHVHAALNADPRSQGVEWELVRELSTLSKTAALIAVLAELPEERHTNEFVWAAIEERTTSRHLPDAALNHDKAVLMLSMLPEDFSWSSALAWLVRNDPILEAALAPAQS